MNQDLWQQYITKTVKRELFQPQLLLINLKLDSAQVNIKIKVMLNIIHKDNEIVLTIKCKKHKKCIRKYWGTEELNNNQKKNLLNKMINILNNMINIFFPLEQLLEYSERKKKLLLTGHHSLKRMQNLLQITVDCREFIVLSLPLLCSMLERMLGMARMPPSLDVTSA